ncbi:DedA family protein [Agarilytica rhodophyticola]|uniref:DedA family protein n=1 Tax=Agarilytica rhodophyticola TaxID=1737490 RepID=UPI000B340EEB|nr:DedA family protein [Agarilytica rhodophyticola]
MQSLLEYSDHPALLVMAIIVIAWIWEDAALIYGALLAAEGELNVALSVVAIFIGICSGDLALYYLGRAAHRWRRVRGWILLNPRSRALSRQFRLSTMTNIFIIRFIPGLRTIGFTLCGLWRISLYRFLWAMSFAGIIWIGTIFTLVYFLGTSAWLEDSDWKWALMGIAVVLLVANNVLARRSMNKPKKKRVSV